MLRWLSLGLAAACCLVLLRIGATAPRHLTLNANEGWNAYHAASVNAGQPLYPSPPGLVVTNYPPLSFYIVGAFGRVVGDVMLAGRLLSLVSFLVWAAALVLTARRLGCSWTEAGFAAVLLTVNILVFVDYYVGVNDPQMLAQAAAAFGPLILLREPRSSGSLFASALLFTVSLFIKHNLVAIPLACVVWLLSYDRRSGWRLMAFGALLGIAAVGACVAFFGPGFLEHLTSPRSASAAKLLTMTRGWIPVAAFPLVVLALLVARAGHDRRVAFGVTLAAISTLVTVWSFSMAGVYWNMAFDSAWALGLIAALAVHRLPAGSDIATARLRAALVAGYLAVPGAVVAGNATIHWGSPRFWIDPRWAEVDSSQREIEFLAAQHGRVLCENLALCYWAGKPAEVDFFSLSERTLRRPGSEDELLQLVEGHRFGVAQIDDPTHELGARFDAAMRRNYVLDHKGRWGSFLVATAP